MDTSYEDRMYQQIEKSLTNNINDRFVPIEIIDQPSFSNSKTVDSTSEYEEEQQSLSRAEYILQAREACLKQLNTLTSTRINDLYIGNEDTTSSSPGKKSKDKSSKLFYEGSDEESSSEELASFRFLIIRTICAAVIFLSIFTIDKVKMDWGGISYNTINNYLTDNNHFKKIEDIIVSLLNKQ